MADEDPRLSPEFDLELRAGASETPRSLASNEVLLHVVHDVGGQPDLPLE